MTIDKKLLEILVCPESRTSLSLASDELIHKLNLKIKSGELHDRSGASLTEEIESGLVREDGQVLYPIRNGIPVLLIESGILTL